MITISPINFIEKGVRKVDKASFSYLPILKKTQGDVFTKSSDISFGASFTADKPDCMDNELYQRIMDKYDLRLSKGLDNGTIKNRPLFVSQVREIFKNTTEKNIDYVERLVFQVHNGRLPLETVADMLNYINKTDESKEDIEFKIDFMSNIEENLKKCLGEKLYTREDCKALGEEESSFFEDINSTLYPILLKTDVLTSKSDSNNFIKTSAKKISELAACNKGFGKKDPKENISRLNKQKLTAKYLGEIILASTIMTKGVLNNFAYNFDHHEEYFSSSAEVRNQIRKVVRGEGDNIEPRTDEEKIFSRFAKELRVLNKRDIEILRDISKHANDAVGESEYRLSSGAIINTLDAIGTRRLLMNKFPNCDEEIKEYKTLENQDGYSFSINNMEFNLAIMKPVLMSNGLDDKTVTRYLEKYNEALRREAEEGIAVDRSKFWDIKHFSLLAENSASLKELVRRGTEVVANAPDIDKLNMQEIFLNDVKNRASDGLIKGFKDANADFDKWLKPGIEPEVYDTKKCKTPNGVVDEEVLRMVEDNPNRKTKVYTAQLWRRIPQESIFDGNCTSCCTGIGKSKGDSFPGYLTHGYTNIVEVRNERGEVKGMSRIYLGEVKDSKYAQESEYAILIDNIEVNKITRERYLSKPEDAIHFRNMIFRYVTKLAEEISVDKDHPLKVYTTTSCPKMDQIFGDLDKSDASRKFVKIIGSGQGSNHINITIGGSCSEYSFTPTAVLLKDVSTIDISE